MKKLSPEDAQTVQDLMLILSFHRFKNRQTAVHSRHPAWLRPTLDFYFSLLQQNVQRSQKYVQRIGIIYGDGDGLRHNNSLFAHDQADQIVELIPWGMVHVIRSHREDVVEEHRQDHRQTVDFVAMPDIGDEFVAVIHGIDDEHLARKEAQLHEIWADPECVVRVQNLTTKKFVNKGVSVTTSRYVMHDLSENHHEILHRLERETHDKKQLARQRHLRKVS